MTSQANGLTMLIRSMVWPAFRSSVMSVLQLAWRAAVRMHPSHYEIEVVPIRVRADLTVSGVVSISACVCVCASIHR